jgi:hypothetical protein
MVFSELRTVEPDRKFLFNINRDLPWPALIAAAFRSDVKARLILVTQRRRHYHAEFNDYSGTNHKCHYDHAALAASPVPLSDELGDIPGNTASSLQG